MSKPKGLADGGKKTIKAGGVEEISGSASSLLLDTETAGVSLTKSEYVRTLLLLLPLYQFY